jgi:hypothetical protein
VDDHPLLGQARDLGGDGLGAVGRLCARPHVAPVGAHVGHATQGLDRRVGLEGVLVLRLEGLCRAREGGFDTAVVPRDVEPLARRRRQGLAMGLGTEVDVGPFVPEPRAPALERRPCRRRRWPRPSDLEDVADARRPRPSAVPAQQPCRGRDARWCVSIPATRTSALQAAVPMTILGPSTRFVGWPTIRQSFTSLRGALSGTGSAAAAATSSPYDRRRSVGAWTTVLSHDIPPPAPSTPGRRGDQQTRAVAAACRSGFRTR